MPPSRTVTPYSPPRTPPAPRDGRSARAAPSRLSYRIRTRSRRSTASRARRSRPRAASRPRTPPASSSTSPCRTRSRNGREPATGRRRCWRSRSTSVTASLTLQT